MTRHDLPRCPFCGGWPEDDDGIGLDLRPVACRNLGCVIEGLHMTEVAWSRRPIEAAAEADLIHAREVGDRRKADLEQMKANFDAMAEIAERELAIIKRGL
jgi:predicted NBD/HSP70 family sugar kinase